MSSEYIPIVFIGFVVLLLIVSIVRGAAARSNRYSSSRSDADLPPYLADGSLPDQPDTTSHGGGHHHRGHHHSGHDAGSFGGGHHSGGHHGGGHDAGSFGGGHHSGGHDAGGFSGGHHG
ncbi:hypothetical protein ACEZDB_32995 [Streptacidiphilus sp. N1-3]|uniref:Secreted protein n=1 Tax=Streptacidiphilus alkalitolerans TaxID=3342712 RepID=A0ABV6XB14_9ACTN